MEAWPLKPAGGEPQCPRSGPFKGQTWTPKKGNPEVSKINSCLLSDCWMFMLESHHGNQHTVLHTP